MVNPQFMLEGLRRMGKECNDRDAATSLFNDADTVQFAMTHKYRLGKTVFEEIATLIDTGQNRIERIGNGRIWYLTDGDLYCRLRKGFDLEFARVYIRHCKQFKK